MVCELIQYEQPFVVSRAASLFYLIPPATALIAWPVFGEQFGLLPLLGMALTVFGVALARGEGES